MFKKLSLKLLLALLLTFVFAQGVSAAGVTISPPKFEFEIEPGDTVVGEVKIVNDEDTDLALSTNVQDFIAGGETGTPTFIDPEENDESISLGKWIQLVEPEFTIQARSKKAVQFTITAPENAEPGGHYGTIFFAPPGGEGQLSVVQQIGALVLVRVKGEVKEVGNLETFGSYALSEGKTFEDAIEQGFYETPPVKFVVRYKNDGNVHLKPSGKIEIFNILGKPLKNIGLKDVLNPQGVLKDQEIVDYIPVNQGLGNVLAKSIRMFTMEYKGEAFWYRFDDGTKELRYKGFPVGRYTAKLTLSGASGEEIVEEFSFIVFPWKVIVGYTVLAIVALFVLIKFRKWRSKSLRDKIKKELQKEMKK